MFRTGEAYQFDWSHEDVEIAGKPMRSTKAWAEKRQEVWLLRRSLIWRSQRVVVRR